MLQFVVWISRFTILGIVMIVSANTALTQSFSSTSVSLMPPAHSLIRTATEFEGRIYAVHVGGGLVSYSTSLTDPQRVSAFAGIAIREVFVYADVMVAVTYDGKFYVTTNGSDFTSIGIAARLHSREPDMKPYLWTWDGLYTLSVSGGQVTPIQLSMVPCPKTAVSFVIVGDTILYTDYRIESEYLYRQRFNGEELGPHLLTSARNEFPPTITKLSNRWLCVVLPLNEIIVSDVRHEAGKTWQTLYEPFEGKKAIQSPLVQSATVPNMPTCFVRSSSNNGSVWFSFVRPDTNETDTVSRWTSTQYRYLPPIALPSGYLVDDALLHETTIDTLHVLPPGRRYLRNIRGKQIRDTLMFVGKLTDELPDTRDTVLGMTGERVYLPFGTRGIDDYRFDVRDFRRVGDRLFILTNQGLYDYDDVADTVTAVLPDVRLVQPFYGDMYVSGDTIIIVGSRFIAVSVNGGAQWNKCPVRNATLRPSLIARVGDHVVLHSAEATMMIHVDSLVQRDTVSSLPVTFGQVNHSLVQMSGAFNGKFHFVREHSRPTTFNRSVNDSLTLYQWDPLTFRLDSTKLVLTSPGLRECTSFFLRDTLRVVFLKESRLLDIVNGSIVRDTTYSLLPLGIIYHDYLQQHNITQVLHDSTGFVVYSTVHGIAQVVRFQQPDTTLSVNEVAASIRISDVAPNPARSAVTVRLLNVSSNDHHATSLRIYDVVGNRVSEVLVSDVTWTSSDEANVTINLDHVPTGTYLLRVEHGRASDTHLVTVIR